MIQEETAALFCLVCVVGITPGKATPAPMPSPSETKLLVEQYVISTTTQENGSKHSDIETPSPEPPPRPKPKPVPMPLPKRPPPPPPPPPAQEKVDEIIDYCCTQASVNCSVIQPNGMCYFPFNKVSDASDFKGSGLMVTQNPSVGNCT